MSLWVFFPFVATGSQYLYLIIAKPNPQTNFANEFVSWNMNAIRGRITEYKQGFGVWFKHPVYIADNLVNIVKVTGDHKIVTFFATLMQTTAGEFGHGRTHELRYTGAICLQLR